MTISHLDAGLVLRFSREELPGRTSREELLPLICQALARARLPFPPSPELRCFYGREELLCFLLPRLSVCSYRPKNTPAFPC